MRSSWGFTNDTVATFICNPYYFGNHDHVDNNSFMIYRKGAIAPSSGGFENGDGGDHTVNYYYRLSLKIHVDLWPRWNIPHITFPQANDGGQIFPYPLEGSMSVADLVSTATFSAGGIERYEANTKLRLYIWRRH